jgi:hypothetical protein
MDNSPDSLHKGGPRRRRHIRGYRCVPIRLRGGPCVQIRFQCVEYLR